MSHPWVMYNNYVKHIQIRHGSKKLWHGHGFWACVHCDLDLGDMTLGQSLDTSFGHGQQLCEVLSRSNMVNEELWPRNRFWVCVHSDLGDLTLGQVHDTHLGYGQQ